MTPAGPNDCAFCDGVGRIHSPGKNGDPWDSGVPCPSCDGVGTITLTPLPNTECALGDIESECVPVCRASRDHECIWDECPANGDRLFNHCPLASECETHGKQERP